MKYESRKQKQKLARELVAILNSTGPSFGGVSDIISLGNKELRDWALTYYQESRITFDRFKGLWRAGA